MKKIVSSFFIVVLSFCLLSSVVDAAQVTMVKTNSKVVFKQSAQFQGTGKYQKLTCSITGSGSLVGDCSIINVSNNTIPATLDVGNGINYPNNSSKDVFLNKGQTYIVQARVDIETNNGTTVIANINN